MLVVAYAGILAAGQAGNERQLFSEWKIALAAKTIATFGLLLGLIWAYVCHDHFGYLKQLRDRAIGVLPEYRRLRDISRNRFRSSTALMAYGVPALAAAMWVVLLVLI
jgi:hypothetical protein